MKLLQLHFPSRRTSIARLAFTVAACLSAAAAVALAAPRRLPLSDSLKGKPTKIASLAVPTGEGAVPPSMSERVQVMIELDAPPAAAIYAEAHQAAQVEANALKQSTAGIPLAAAQKGALPKIEINAAATARVQNQVTTLDATQQALLPAIKNAGAHVTYRTQRAFNGIAVRVSPDKIAELAKLPGVKAVRPMTRHYPTAFNDIDFLGGRSFWTKATENGVGLHGEGITIAVIDTGLDYVHTNFGGPGTKQAYSVSQDKDPVPNPYYPTAKVPFGYDFAGDAYTADNDPMPDDNPMDTNGHGTGCASIAAGLGVNFGGTTYQGNYDGTAPDIGAMKISPGFAPGAQLVPLRVFGTEGGTFLATQAIDYAMDPNGDGNFNDHVDVISMSLGSPNGSPDDDSAVAASNAVAAGVIVISSAGNEGDTYYITGSPGSATGVIATAASYNDQSGFITDAAVVANSPDAIRGNKSIGIYTTNSAKRAVTADIVQMKPNDSPTATTPVTNASQLAGKIAYLDRVPGQGANAAARAKAAGAIGLIYGADQTGANGDPFLLTTGSSTPRIPEIVISMKDGQFIKSFSQFDPNTGVAARPINATIRAEGQVVSRGGGPADTMPSYSSRGPQIGTNALKPNLTAPAEVVGVASAQSGSQAKLFNGTSSSTPHVAGAIAIAKQLHPTWSVLELNALMMNTATHDLFTTTARTTRYGVSRVGAGRVDFDLASKSNVVVFNSSDPSTVSVSFGAVEVPSDGKVAISKNVTIRNKGTTDVTYKGSIQMLNTVGDSNFSAPQTNVLVKAGEEATFPLLFRATGNTLKKTRDPSVSNGQGVGGTTLAREWLAEAAGYGVLTPTTAGPGATVIRIPLYASPKPASSMHANTRTFEATGATGSFSIPLSGAPVNTGGSSFAEILSLVKAFELQYASPLAESPKAPNDPEIIKYVGVTSDYPVVSNKQNTTLTFGIDGFGDATVPSFVSSDKQIRIDLNFDGEPDYLIYLDSVRINGTNPPTHSNVYIPVLLNLGSGDGFYTGYFTNLYPSNFADVNPFNNSSVLVSVDAKDLGYTGAGQSSFNYWIETYDQNTGDLKDRTPTMHYDIARPGFNVQHGEAEPFYDIDFPGAAQNIPVQYDGQNIQRNKSLGVLLIHRHNSFGNRSETVTLRSPTIESFSPDHGPAGTRVTIRGRNFDPNTTVRFSPNVAAPARVLSETTLVTNVPAGAKTGPITVSNGVGSSKSAQRFTITPPPEPSPSPSPMPTASPTQ